MKIEKTRIRPYQKKRTSESEYRDGDWVGSVAVIIDGCPSEAYAVEGAVDKVLGIEDIKELNEGKLLGDIV